MSEIMHKTNGIPDAMQIIFQDCILPSINMAIDAAFVTLACCYYQANANAGTTILPTSVKDVGS
eukprot:5166093-Pyramimonas_sp.AAC.1